MKFISFLFVILSISCHKDQSEVSEISGSWEQVFNYFPGMKGRFNPISWNVPDTLIYGLGEYMSSEERIFNDLWCFTEGIWRKLGYFPGGKRINSLLFLLENRVYVGLGESYFLSSDRTCRDLWSYDLKSQMWDSLGFQFPGKKREGALLFKVGKVIYYGAGTDGGKMLSDIYTFDEVNGWSKALPEFVDCQAYTTISEVNGEIYSCFGKDDKEYLRTIRRFNIAQKKWETVYVLKEEEYAAVARINAKAFVLDQKGRRFVYFIGGQPIPGIQASAFWECCRYDLETNEIVRINAPQVKEVEAAFTIENEGYIFDSENIWKFTP